MLSFLGGSFDALYTPLMACGDEGSAEETKEADPSLVDISDVGEMANSHGGLGSDGVTQALHNLRATMQTQLKTGTQKF